MRKILIITYFFPPGNFAGSYRLYSWARYLKQFGFYPIIVTRHWEKDQTDYAGISSNKNLTIINENGYEIHYIPYKGNVRDKIKKNYNNKYRLITKFLSLIELIFQNFFLFIIPSKELYYYSKKILEKNHDIKYVIASGKPYILFKFGYLLKKKFPYIRWIPDYRDPWNTHWWLIQKMPRFLKQIESRSEKKWLSNADGFITCSEVWCNDISKFTNKNGYLVFNGFDDENDNANSNTQINNEIFTIIHNGSIYGLHNISIFIESVKRIIDSGYTKIRILFPGILIDLKEGERLRNSIIGYESYFTLSARIPRNELIPLIAESQLLLVFGTTEMKGWYPLKLFEYLISNKPILHCPGDNDVITNMINKTQTGYVTYSIEETTTLLAELYTQWIDEKTLKYNPNKQIIAQFSRIAQTQKLAEHIQSIDDNFLYPINKTTKFRQKIFETGYKLGFHNVLRKTNTSKDALILCFHDISDIPNPSYPSLPVKQFEQIIEYLSKSYEFSTINNLYRHTKSNKTQVILSFDDGYKSFRTTVIPILKKYNATAICSVIVDTVDNGKSFWTDRLNTSLNFIIKNFPHYSFNYENVSFDYNFLKYKSDSLGYTVFKLLMDKPNEFRWKFIQKLEDQLNISHKNSTNFMNWDDIKYSVENGMTIASHSLTHNALNNLLDESELEKEIIQSKKIIESKIGTTVSIFTCPNGIYNPKVVDIVQSNGYECMFTTEEHKTRQKFIIKNDNLLILPRISVNKFTFEENIFKINNFFQMITPLKF